MKLISFYCRALQGRRAGGWSGRWRKLAQRTPDSRGHWMQHGNGPAAPGQRLYRNQHQKCQTLSNPRLESPSFPSGRYDKREATGKRHGHIAHAQRGNAPRSSTLQNATGRRTCESLGPLRAVRPHREATSIYLLTGSRADRFWTTLDSYWTCRICWYPRRGRH